MAELPRIFVAIAAYCDPECQWTVKDLFEKAAHPERIFVGICWQADPLKDADCFEMPSPRQEQTRAVLYHPSESQGAGWARSEAMKLWQDEAYILSIDAHMRFAKGWDEKLLAAHAACPSERAVISACLPGYDPPEKFQECSGNITHIRVTMLGRNGDTQPVHLGGGFRTPPERPFPSAFVVGNFIFAPADVFLDVPIDPHLFFYGDEVTYSARLFTHGIDIYQPHEILAYHQWQRPIRGGGAYKQHRQAHNLRSLKRARHLLEVEHCNDGGITQDLASYGLGESRTLEAFWEFSGVRLEPSALSDKATQGNWAPAPPPAHAPRIFVQIASYRDPECQWTVKDLFAKASRPERIFVGICWQFIRGDDDDCFVEPYPRPGQVRVIEVDARESQGACWARSKTQSLWEGEEYTLQIDSHMRFEPGWDDTLIAMCKESGSSKPVISTYPPGYTPPDDLKKGWLFSMKVKEYDKNGILLMCGHGIRTESAPPRPIRGAFAAAGFLFAPSQIIRDVPYDPHLYFFGEEITLIARLWTHGWDFFHPHLPIIYHDWDRHLRKKTHFDDHRDWPKMNERSIKRVRHLLGIEPSKDPAVTGDMAAFGLGSVRTLEAYQQFAGVNFKAKTASDFAKSGEEYPVFSVPSAAVSSSHPSPGVSLMSAHQPRKVFETPEAIIYDDFLPEPVFQKLYDFMCQTDYKHINTDGKVSRVWRPRDGFPLRTMLNSYYYSEPPKQDTKPEWQYPTNTAFDDFTQHINAMMPTVGHFTGQPKKEWDHFTVTGWIYPKNTALGLHDDGAGIYSGAYAFFMTPEWDIHWGGLLMLLHPDSNRALQAHKKQHDIYAYYRRKWIDPREENAFLFDPGFAQCVFPKRNRIVFIHPDAYHWVTKVNEDAGDRVRMSLAGFFMRGKK